MSTNLVYELHTNVEIPTYRGRWVRLEQGLAEVMDNSNSIKNLRADFPVVNKEIPDYDVDKMQVRARQAAYKWSEKHAFKHGLAVRTSLTKGDDKWYVYFWLENVTPRETGLEGTKAIGIDA